MRLTSVAVLVLSSLLALAGCAGPRDIAGADYLPEYDYSEFFWVTNNKTFRVVVYGNPFPDMPKAEMERRLLPVMQANKPEPNLTFTYAVPAEEPRPDYRLVLVFNPATDLTAARVCVNDIRHKPTPARPFDLFAVYCRNELYLSQAQTWTPATSPEDPRVGELFNRLFVVLFDPFRRPHTSGNPFMMK